MASEAPPVEGEGAPETELLDVSRLSQFLAGIAPLLLDGDAGEFEAALVRNEHVLKQFISDTQTPLLLIQYSPPTPPSVLSEAEEPGSPSPPHQLYQFDVSMRFVGNASSLALIKKGSQLEAGKSPGAQLQVINLGYVGLSCCSLAKRVFRMGSPFETLRSYVQKSFQPFFTDFVKKTHNYKDDGRESKPGTLHISDDDS